MMMRENIYVCVPSLPVHASSLLAPSPSTHHRPWRRPAKTDEAQLLPPQGVRVKEKHLAPGDYVNFEFLLEYEFSVFEHSFGYV